MDRVTAAQIGHIFVGVIRAGAASGRPYEEKFKCGGACQQSYFKFEMALFTSCVFARPMKRGECGIALRLRK
jgi:hypothetical protein